MDRKTVAEGNDQLTAQKQIIQNILRKFEKKSSVKYPRFWDTKCIESIDRTQIVTESAEIG
jgi:hypothetical protein